MKKLKDDTNLDDFFDRLAKAKNRVLITDFGGTLAPIVFEWRMAKPYKGIRSKISQIMEDSKTRVIVISGRPLHDLKVKLDLESPPELWGTHGWERLTEDGRFEIWQIDEVHEKALEEAIFWARENHMVDRLETKVATVAFHWEAAVTVERERIQPMAIEKFTDIANRTGLLLHKFNGGVELHTPGRNKGVAVETVLKEMDEDTVVACVGDDLTDEDAFRVLGDRALNILVRTEYRETEADLWLRPPRELLRFFDRWIDATTSPAKKKKKTKKKD